MLGLHKNRRDDRGDTIVEVLIAITIVGVVLVTAYQITARNTGQIQGAQERGQATKLVQSQIELLRAGSFRPGLDICFTGGGQAVPATTPAQCKVDATGSPTTVEPAYDLRVVQGASSYAVSATWDAPGSDLKSNVTVFYRP